MSGRALTASLFCGTIGIHKNLCILAFAERLSAENEHRRHNLYWCLYGVMSAHP